MKMNTKILALAVLLTSVGTANAAPLPHTILIKDRAVVPVLKTEVVRTIAGQAPERNVQATVFEVTNQGKDIKAHQIDLTDHQGQFSDRPMSAPVVQKGSVIVPTSKIEVTSTLKQEGQAILQTKQISAEGMEFKRGADPVKRTLDMGQISDPNANHSATRTIMTENGVATRDVVVIKDQ